MGSTGRPLILHYKHHAQYFDTRSSQHHTSNHLKFHSVWYFLYGDMVSSVLIYTWYRWILKRIRLGIELFLLLKWIFIEIYLYKYRQWNYFPRCLWFINNNISNNLIAFFSIINVKNLFNFWHFYRILKIKQTLKGILFWKLSLTLLYSQFTSMMLSSMINLYEVRN